MAVISPRQPHKNSKARGDFGSSEINPFSISKLDDFWRRWHVSLLPQSAENAKRGQQETNGTIGNA
jgi:hypothetical protein